MKTSYKAVAVFAVCLMTVSLLTACGNKKQKPKTVPTTTTTTEETTTTLAPTTTAETTTTAATTKATTKKTTKKTTRRTTKKIAKPASSQVAKAVKQEVAKTVPTPPAPKPTSSGSSSSTLATDWNSLKTWTLEGCSCRLPTSYSKDEEESEEDVLQISAPDNLNNVVITCEENDSSVFEASKEDFQESMEAVYQVWDPDATCTVTSFTKQTLNGHDMLKMEILVTINGQHLYQIIQFIGSDKLYSVVLTCIPNSDLYQNQDKVFSSIIIR